MTLSMLLLPIVYTIFIWWFTTGSIMVVYNRARWMTRLFFAIYTAIAALAFAGLLLTRDINDTAAVYVAVTCGILIWGWHVTAYYLGFVTGPRSARESLAAMNDTQNLTLKDRFALAFVSSLHHEVLAVVTGIVIALLTNGHINRWGLWIYLALWIMHGSSRLNIFLGVRNFSVDLLPRNFRYLRHVVSRRDFNEFFPVSVLIASVVMLTLIFQIITPDTSPLYLTGAIMVATMLFLGILEHGLLMLPPSLQLWNNKAQAAHSAQVEQPKLGRAPQYETGE